MPGGTSTHLSCGAVQSRLWLKVFGVIPNICRMLVDGNGLAIASNLARLGKSRAGGSSCNGQIASMPKGNDALFAWSEIQSAKGRA